MTSEEAKQIIYNQWQAFLEDNIDYAGISEAYKMAIKALEQQPHDDCISRQATIDAIYKKHVGGKDAIENAPINDLYACGLEEAVDAVENMPSVTPQQRVGKWIAQDIHNCHTDFKCSECGYIHNFTHLYGEPTADYTYCPTCGARMEVEE